MKITPMELRLPDSGLLLEALLSRLGSPTEMGGGSTVRNATEAQINEAIDAMIRGHIEYVILDDGGPFVQAAGEGPGPYALEHCPGDSESIVEVPGGVDAETMRKVLVAYGRGDLGWRGALAWAPLSDGTR